MNPEELKIELEEIYAKLNSIVVTHKKNISNCTPYAASNGVQLNKKEVLITIESTLDKIEGLIASI